MSRERFSINHPNPDVQARIDQKLEAQRLQLVPIVFRYSSDVAPQYAQAALRGIQGAIHISGQQRVLITEDATGASLSADSLLRRAHQRRPLGTREFGRNIEPQIDANEVVIVLMQDALAEKETHTPHLEIVLTGLDLTQGDLNFAYRSTQTDFSSIFSIRRFLAVADDLPDDLLEPMIERLARQNIGFIFGLPNEDRGFSTVDTLGEHCTNVCTMRQALNIQEFADHTTQERRDNVTFCADCQIDFFKARSRYQPFSGTTA